MNSQDMKNAISGVLVVDKPVGMTSHDVVQAIRNGTGLRRAGHTGTLDPRASGVLVILVGPAVRLSEYVSASDKRYQAIIRLGGKTDTFDAEGWISTHIAARNQSRLIIGVWCVSKANPSQSAGVFIGASNTHIGKRLQDVAQGCC